MEAVGFRLVFNLDNLEMGWRWAGTTILSARR
jgi:hypothetical protein